MSDDDEKTLPILRDVYTKGMWRARAPPWRMICQVVTWRWCNGRLDGTRECWILDRAVRSFETVPKILAREWNAGLAANRSGILLASIIHARLRYKRNREFSSKVAISVARNKSYIGRGTCRVTATREECGEGIRQEGNIKLFIRASAEQTTRFLTLSWHPAV